MATENNEPTARQVRDYASFWYRSAIDNLGTAKALLRTKRYNFSMFMCQQAVEAILKCAFVELRKERPPFLHKLPRLLTLTGLEVPMWVDKIILSVDAHYMKARYFNDRFDRRIYNHRGAARLIDETEKVLKWFSQELKLKR